MKEPNYEDILKAKIEYYGETKAAYEFATHEYTRQYIELNNLSQHLVIPSFTCCKNIANPNEICKKQCEDCKMVYVG